MSGRSGGDVLVEVERSGVVESLHRGHVVVLDPDGSVRAAVGDVTSPIFPRSALKPVQAAAMLACGLDVTPEQLALAAASHAGEPMHVAVVESMLADGGLDEADLECPPDLPLSASAAAQVTGPQRIYMNCSGKHAAMLRVCVARDWPLSGYVAPAHRLQREIAATVLELTGDRADRIGVDGCGAPVIAVSLTGLARAFGGLVTSGSPVVNAMRTYPELVDGPGRVTTRLMQGLPGAVVKNGAEGVYAAALADGGCLALKIDDGAARAADRVVVAALRRLGAAGAVLDDLAEMAVLGGGEPVGAVRFRDGAV